MKHLDGFLTLAGIVMAVISATVLFQVTSVLADHDKDEKAHPALIQSLRDTQAELKQLNQKIDFVQAANEKDHGRQEESMKSQAVSMKIVTEMLVTIVAKLP